MLDDRKTFQRQRAILISSKNDSMIQEALGLASAAGYEIVESFTQRHLSRGRYGVGSGKASEIAETIKKMGLKTILFDKTLSSSQIYNLAKLTGAEVIDREKLILDIFSKRASTTEAKLQVELAELRYEMPRAREKVRMARMGEQPGFFGLGRYEVDIYYRSIRRRVSHVSKKLQEVKKRRNLHRYTRAREDIPTISIAGYTGAGKTTLFNLLTGESKPVADESFTTLTTTTRAINLLGSKTLVSDTVGFISRLPTYVIEAFKSTLEEQVYADLILLIVDISEEEDDLHRKYLECVSVMSELGVSPSKVLHIFNKVDKLNTEDVKDRIFSLLGEERKFNIVSAKFGYGIDDLKSTMHRLLYSNISEMNTKGKETPQYPKELTVSDT